MKMSYHYCAQYQISPGMMAHIDGIVTVFVPIDTMDRYKEIKKVISPEHADKLTIVSLTALPQRRKWYQLG